VRKRVCAATQPSDHSPSPNHTDGEASNPGPPHPAGFDDPDGGHEEELFDHAAFDEQEVFPFETDFVDAATAHHAPWPSDNGGADTPMLPTWMGDAGFDNSVLHTWRGPEAWCGLKDTPHKLPKHAAATIAATMPPLPDGVNFVAVPLPKKNGPPAFISSAPN